MVRQWCIFFLFCPLFFCYYCSILKVTLCGSAIFSFLIPIFVTAVERTRPRGWNNESGVHMQQWNSGNEMHNIGGGMGVFFSGSYRSIGQKSSFFYSRSTTQGGYGADITLAKMSLQ